MSETGDHHVFFVCACEMFIVGMYYGCTWIRRAPEVGALTISLAAARITPRKCLYMVYDVSRASSSENLKKKHDVEEVWVFGHCHAHQPPAKVSRGGV